MLAQTKADEFALGHVLVCRNWGDALAIRDPSKNLALLPRPPKRWFALTEILDSEFRSVSMVFGEGDDPLLIGAELDHVLQLRSEDALSFFEDVMGLSQEFLKVTGGQNIGIKLEKISTDNCSTFHVDYVPMRLITTYLGQGTEWLHDEDVNRAGLGKQRNDLVMQPLAEIQRVPAQTIAILKGERFPGGSGRALVHRSPSVKSKRDERLLLRMDAIEE